MAGWWAAGGLLLHFGLRISNSFPSASLKSWFLFFGNAGVWGLVRELELLCTGAWDFAWGIYLLSWV
jgi:hypothetical protein